VVKALKAAAWADQIDWQTPTPVQQRDLMPWVERVHHPQYVQALREFANRGGGRIDADTTVSPRSFEVAMLAVSAWMDGVDAVLAMDNPAFVLSRPPGHHAEPEQGMGFCLLSNAAIAAYYGLDQAGIERVAILDWDVHHGNGTQTIVEQHPKLAYCSTHQSPCYPGTGSAQEQGAHRNILNLPMKRGSTIADYKPAFEQKIIPFLQDFQPDLLIVSAGYDANAVDPLAGMELEPQDFGTLTQYCLQVTRRIVFGLEGGYHFDALSQSVAATIEQCL
jgi:acetoin utilization deacetylase AcuC-like enzyme